MRVLLQDGHREIEILDRRHLVDFYDQDLARAFFRRLLADPGSRAALRRALAEDAPAGGLWRLEDERIAAELARRAVYGELRIVVRRAGEQGPASAGAAGAGGRAPTPLEAEQAAREERSPAGEGAAGDQGAPAEAAAQPSTPPAAPPGASAGPEDEAAEPESDPLLAGIDPVAQAGALEAAAATGAPLCEL